MAELFILLACLHLLIDYHLQPESLARGKARGLPGLMLHLLIAGLVLAVPLLWRRDLWRVSMVVWLSHVALDGLKWLLGAGLNRQQSWAEGAGKALYVLDQVAHLLALWLAVRWLAPPDALAAAQSLPALWLKGTLLCLLCTRPANVSFKQLFGAYAPPEEDAAPGRPGAGALIGSMERLISLLLLAVGQYAAMGLVLTAKSIARYDRISKSQGFAEYYLIGTLFSVLWVITSYLAVTGLL